MIRIKPRVYYVLDTDREEFRLIGCECGHFSSTEQLFEEMASTLVFNSERYRYASTDEEIDRMIRVEERLARLLAHWHRDAVQSEPEPNA